MYVLAITIGCQKTTLTFIRFPIIFDALAVMVKVFVKSRSGNSNDTLARSNMGVSAGYIFLVALAGFTLNAFTGILNGKYF